MGRKTVKNKVDVPDSVTSLNWSPLFEWHVGWFWLQERLPKRHHVFQRD